MSPKRRSLTHCRVIELNSFSAMFNQLPCLGVWRNSKRRTIDLAFSGSNAS